jgi:hypothetical protein
MDVSRNVTAGAKFNQIGFARDRAIPQCRGMSNGADASRNFLVIAVFCAIIGLIGLAGFMH